MIQGRDDTASKVGAIPFGKWRHELGVVTDEARVDKLLLKVLGHQLVQQPGCGLGRHTLYAVVLALQLVFAK